MPAVPAAALQDTVARVSPPEVANVSAGKAFVLPQVAVPDAWQ